MNYNLLAKINDKFKFENITREKLLVYLYGICILMVLLLYLIYLINRQKGKKYNKKNDINKFKNIKKIENINQNNKNKKENKLEEKTKNIEKEKNAEIKKIYKTIKYIGEEVDENTNTNRYINQAFSGNDFFYEEKIKEEERKILKEQMLKNAIIKLENIVDKDDNNG